MHWIPILIVVVVVAGFILLKKSGEISAQAALAHLRNGALVVDVRSRSEFNSSHLPEAVNVPLDEIETALPRRVPNKNQTVLLHCLSGTRSGVAKVKLKGTGYPNVFNLGSYGRAESILKQQDWKTNVAVQIKEDN